MFALTMLVRLGRITEQDVRSTFAAFQKLDKDNEGILTSKRAIRPVPRNVGNLLAPRQRRQLSNSSLSERSILSRQTNLSNPSLNEDSSLLHPLASMNKGGENYMSISKTGEETAADPTQRLQNRGMSFGSVWSEENWDDHPR